MICELFMPGVMGCDMKTAITSLVNGVKMTGYFPSFMELADICTIYKMKGSRLEMSSDRGIFMLNILQKNIWQADIKWQIWSYCSWNVWLKYWCSEEKEHKESLVRCVRCHKLCIKRGQILYWYSDIRSCPSFRWTMAGWLHERPVRHLACRAAWREARTWCMGPMWRLPWLWTRPLVRRTELSSGRQFNRVECSALLCAQLQSIRLGNCAMREGKIYIFTKAW